jgi:type II secretory pathway pseudopilin PulG
MRATARRSTPGEAQRGVTYLVLLLAIALVSGVLAASSAVWSQVQRRERERQLLWVGEQFRVALMAYAAAGDGRYPQRLEDLLEDPRSQARRRHLRRIYDDPMTRGTDWAFERDPRGGIVAVHSRATQAPIKRAGFGPEFAHFEQARSYADWVFAAAPTLLRPPVPAPRAASAPAGAASAAAPLPARPAPTPTPAADAASAPASPAAEPDPEPPATEEPPAEPAPPEPD